MAKQSTPENWRGCTPLRRAGLKGEPASAQPGVAEMLTELAESKGISALEDASSIGLRRKFK
jgi:hypothetical protein